MKQYGIGPTRSDRMKWWGPALDPCPVCVIITTKPDQQLIFKENVICGECKAIISQICIPVVQEILKLYDIKMIKKKVTQ